MIALPEDSKPDTESSTDGLPRPLAEDVEVLGGREVFQVRHVDRVALKKVFRGGSKG